VLQAHAVDVWPVGDGLDIATPASVEVRTGGGAWGTRNQGPPGRSHSSLCAAPSVLLCKLAANRSSGQMETARRTH
jgi:hypothetical protein